MSSAPSVERPRVVTVLGWIWLVLGVLQVARAFIDLLVWRVLRGALPVLLGPLERSDRAAPPGARMILEHLTEVKLVQALFWGAGAAAGIGLLRMRPWARKMAQVLGAILIVYLLGVTFFWISALLRASPHPGSWDLPDQAGMAAGIAFSLAVGAALVAMIVVLRSSPVRDAFRFYSPARPPVIPVVRRRG